MASTSCAECQGRLEDVGGSTLERCTRCGRRFLRAGALDVRLTSAIGGAALLRSNGMARSIASRCWVIAK